MSITTLKDIAAAAGVSIDAVSRILNGKTKGHWARSAEKIERVKELARQMNYKPNKAAQFMRTSRTHQIGLIGSELYNPYTGQILELFAEELANRGYGMLLGLVRGQGTQLSAELDQFSRNLMDGVVNFHPLVDSVQLKRHLGQVPSVVFNRSTKESPALVNILEGVHLALRHLWELGHRRIAIVSSDGNKEDRQGRIQAFEAFFRSVGAKCEPEWMIHTGWRFEDGEAAVDSFLATKCTACLAGNDLLGVALCSGLRVRGFEVPTHYSVVSMDDTMLVKISRPHLTSLRPPIREITRLTLDSLMAQIEGQPAPAVRSMTPELVVRQSTGNPAPA